MFRRSKENDAVDQEDEEYKKLKSFLENSSPSIQDNVTIVTPESIGQNQVFHISRDPNIKFFEPVVSRRTMNIENRSLPRISTAKTLVGCIQGYMSDIVEFRDAWRKDLWRGGWYIYGINFEYAVEPNEKVLPDAEGSNEIWIVPYKQDLWKVKPVVLGKFFYTQIAERTVRNEAFYKREGYLKLSTGTLRVTEQQSVEKGYYYFRLPEFNFNAESAGIEPEEFFSVSRSEFERNRKTSTDMLSMVDCRIKVDLPKSVDW